MPGQNTFTLIPDRCTTPNNGPARPMTSKQVKKAHKAANKQPKLSRAEQRKLELAEQERIRKEMEKDRTAARARQARERKKAKEEAKKEEKRRKGKPLVDARPSQDTIARFVRGNGSGKKRDEQGVEVVKMAAVAEESPIGEEPEPFFEGHMDCEMNDETGDDTRSPLHDAGRTGIYRDTEALEDEQSKQELEDGHSVSQASPGNFIGDDLMAELDDKLKEPTPHPPSAVEDTNRTLSSASSNPPENMDRHERISESTIQDMNFDEFDDDVFIDLGTSFGRKETQQGELEETRVDVELEAQHPESGSRGDFFEDELEDDALQALGVMLSQVSSGKPQVQPTKRSSSPSRQGPRAGLDREFSSFTEDDLDDELLQQLEMREAPGPTAVEHATQEQPSVKDLEPAKQHAQAREPSPCARDLGLNRSSSPPQQRIPLSTQAVLLNFDDYFPSPSQQEFELECDSTPPPTEPSPCPPPKRTCAVPQQLPEPDPSPQKRFFSASGSNELLSLALHRSRRTAALEGIHQQERERVEAGVLEAKRQEQAYHAATPRNSSWCHPSTTMRPPTKMSAARSEPTNRQPAARPPTFKQGPRAASKSPSIHGPARPPPFKQPQSSVRQPQATRPPPFKPAIKPTLPGKENSLPEETAPLASQETEYGGDWIDEMAGDIMDNPR